MFQHPPGLTRNTGLHPMSKAETGLTMPAPCKGNGLLCEAGPTDRELISLAAEIQAAHLQHSDACDANDEVAADTAMGAMEALLDRMADIPADTLIGAAAKMSRLCLSLSEREGRGLMHFEYQVVDSLADDLVRLVPAAVPSLPAPPPLPQTDPEAMPETEWQRSFREDRERLAALGLARRAGFTVGDVQIVGWLLDRIAAEMGEAAAERVRELSGMTERDLDMPPWLKQAGALEVAACAA